MSEKNNNWITVCIIVVAIVIIICLWFLRNLEVERIIKNQDISISRTIQETIKKQAEVGFFIPNIQLVQMDSLHKAVLKDSIIYRATRVFAKKYFNPDSIIKSKISISPFFLFPEYPDKNGNYNLTKTQLDELKNHIYYLAKQVDIAVSTTKAEINNDIARLNMWLTLWIGVLAIFGTVIPFIYHYKMSEDIKQTKKLSEQASKSANDAIKKYEEAEPEIKKIDDIKKDIENISKEIPTLKEDTDTAKEKSKSALENSIKTEKLLFLTNSIQKLNSLDGKVLMYSQDKKSTLINMLKEIKNNLAVSNGLSGNGIMLDLLKNLSLRIHSLSFYTFIGSSEIAEMNKFSIFLKNKLNNLSDDGFTEIVDKMEDLIKNMER